jgi:very-short-patch-repair endonuclease
MWRRQRLIVELQSVTYHGTAVAMTRDADRTRNLMLADWRVLPVTWSQLRSPATAVALTEDLRRLLTR